MAAAAFEAVVPVMVEVAIATPNWSVNAGAESRRVPDDELGGVDGTPWLVQDLREERKWEVVGKVAKTALAAPAERLFLLLLELMLWCCCV
jgi:hypothetical protein